MADFKGFNLGSSVAMSLKNDGAYMLDSKLVAGDVAQALTLASTARFSGMPIFIIEDNCWYSFKDGITDDCFKPVGGTTTDSVSFEEFDKTKTYTIGDYVIYNRRLYECIVTTTADTDFVESEWKLLIGSIEDTFIKIKEVYDEANTYSIDDIVIYNGLVYKAIAETTGVFDRDSWELLIGIEEDKEVIKIKEWKIDTEYLEEAFVIYDNNLYKCNTAHTSTDTFDETNWDLILKGESTEGIEITEFDKTLVYEVGDYVIHNRCVYKCIVETTADTDFDEAQWSIVVGSSGGEGTSLAENVLYENAAIADVNNVKDTLDAIIAELYYVEPKITSFTCVPTSGIFEVGETIDEVVFTWAYNKNITTQSLTDCTLTDETDRTATYSTPITTNKTFTLSASDGKKSVTNSKSFTFVYPTYVGIVENGNVDETNILANCTKLLRTKSAYNGKFTANFQTLVFATPTAFGTLSSAINQNNYEVLDAFTKQEMTINGVSYYVYSLSNVNITDFSYNLKY